MKTYQKSLFTFLILLFSSLISAQSGWDKIAEVQTDLSLDKIKINCANKGTFKALKFKAEGSSVDFKSVYVRYANGAVDNLKFDQSLQSGRFSGVLDLRGNRRVIKEITLYVKSEGTNKNNKGKGKGKRNARVEVWGRK